MRKGARQPGEEKTRGDLITAYKQIKGGCQGDQAVFSSVKEQNKEQSAQIGT